MGKRICTVPTCGKEVNARGWCSGHYARWRTTGDVQAHIPLPVPRAGRICLIPDCGEPVESRDWCVAHYRKFRLYGDPLGSPPPPERKGIYPPGSKTPHEWIVCKGCGERALVRMGGQGYCTKECATAHRAGAAHPLWKGADAGYHSMHSRVYRLRGKADHCSRCGRSDQEVTYQWANLTGDYNDVQDYAPMCPPCHGAYDAHARPRGSASVNAKLTEAIVTEARRRHARGETVSSMAAGYGVSGVALGNAISGRTWRHVPMEVNGGC